MLDSAIVRALQGLMHPVPVPEPYTDVSGYFLCAATEYPTKGLKVLQYMGGRVCSMHWWNPLVNEEDCAMLREELVQRTSSLCIHCLKGEWLVFIGELPAEEDVIFTHSSPDYKRALCMAACAYIGAWKPEEPHVG